MAICMRMSLFLGNTKVFRGIMQPTFNNERDYKVNVVKYQQQGNLVKGV